MKFKRYLLMCITASFCLSPIAMPNVYATGKNAQEQAKDEVKTEEIEQEDLTDESEEDAVPDTRIHLRVNYSKGLSPQTDDLFTLKYYVRSNPKVLEKLSFDASAVSDNEAFLPLPPGEYVVRDIIYNGNNTEISKLGYACTGAFTVQEEVDSTNYIELGIGIEAGNKITKNTDQYICKRNDQLRQSLTLTETEQKELEKEELQRDQSKDDHANEEISDNGEAEVEVAKKKKKKKNAFSWLNIILPVGLISLLGVITTRILKKHGKIYDE